MAPGVLSDCKAAPNGDSAKQSVLVRIAGGITEALCAEPAINAFGRQWQEHMRISVCTPAADLYVGHPQVSGIMYRQEDAVGGFDRTIDLREGAAGLVQLVQDYAGQLGITDALARPQVYVTSMDRLRTRRFGLAALELPVIVIVLPEETINLSKWDVMAADIEERLGGSAVFVSTRKYPALQHGKNLTGRLMPREIAAVLSRADGWIGFGAEAAAIGWAAGTKGIIFAGNDFESPDAGIAVRSECMDRESLLEAVSEMIESDSE